MNYTKMLIFLAIFVALAAVGTWTTIHFFSPVQKPIELRILVETDGPEMQKAKKMMLGK